MKKLQLMMILLLMVSALHAGKGKVHISSEPQGAYIYVDGKKKAMMGEGYTSILLDEGEYVIKVHKPIDELYEYIQSKKVFVGEDTAMNIEFQLSREMTAEGKVILAKEEAKTKGILAKSDVEKLARWKRSSEVVTDTKLGLMWQDNTAVKSTKKSWEDAKKYCSNLSLEGYIDWRLPNYAELLTIVDYDRYKPAIMPTFVNVDIAAYWSSSVSVSFTAHAWIVAFDSGGTNAHSKTNEKSVRCVRGRQSL